MNRILHKGEDIPIVEASSDEEDDDDCEVTQAPDNVVASGSGLDTPTAPRMKKRLRMSDGASAISGDECNPPPSESSSL